MVFSRFTAFSPQSDTFRADVDYNLAEALTKVGILGIKVWICKGEVYGKRDLAPQLSSNQREGSRRDGNGPRKGFRKRNNNR